MASEHGGLSIGYWVSTIILSIVLLAVVAGTYPSLIQQANSFKNATSSNAMASVLVTLLPILIAAAILLVFVFAFLPKLRGGHGR